MLANLLFGESLDVEIVQVEVSDTGLHIHAKTIGTHTNCISCERPAHRVHSRYTRVIRDVALASRPVVLHGKRRFASKASGEDEAAHTWDAASHRCR